MLFFQDPGGELIRIVFIQNGNDGLQNNGASIQCLVDKMHRTTAEPDAMVQRLLLNV